MARAKKYHFMPGPVDPAVIECDMPDFVAAIHMGKKHLARVNGLVDGLLQKVGDLPVHDGLPVVGLKNILLSCYLGALAGFIGQKVRGEDVSGSAFLDQLLQARVVLEKAMLLEKRMSTQISTTLSGALSREFASVNEDRARSRNKADSLFSEESEAEVRLSELPLPGDGAEPEHDSKRRESKDLPTGAAAVGEAPHEDREQTLRRQRIVKNSLSRLASTTAARELEELYGEAPLEVVAGTGRAVYNKALEDEEDETFHRLGGKKRRALEKQSKGRLEETAYTDATILQDIEKVGKLADLSREALMDGRRVEDKIIRKAEKRADRHAKHKR